MTGWEPRAGDADAALGAYCVGGGVLALPCDVPGPAGLRLLPGDLGSEGGAALDAAREIVSRCAAWCRLYVAPRVVHQGQEVDGCYEPGEPSVIAIAVGGGVISAADTAHHECWHAAEEWLSDDALAVVSAAVARGVPRPGAVLASAAERRARLYAAWALAIDEGYEVPAAADGTPLGPLDRVFLAVYRGQLAAAVLAAGEWKPGK